MNSQESSPPVNDSSMAPTLSVSTDNPQLSCAEIRTRGSWERMPGQEIRWKWTGATDRSLCEILGPEPKTHQFPSITNAAQTIHLCKLSDGGILSYELENGVWLHTLNTATSFRMKVFELHLVPLESLRFFLTGCDIPAGTEVIS